MKHTVSNWSDLAIKIVGVIHRRFSSIGRFGTVESHYIIDSLSRPIHLSGGLNMGRHVSRIFINRLAQALSVQQQVVVFPIDELLSDLLNIVFVRPVERDNRVRIGHSQQPQGNNDAVL